MNSARAADHPNNSFIFEIESLQTCPGPAGEEGDHGDLPGPAGEEGDYGDIPGAAGEEGDYADLPHTRLPRII